MPKSEETFGSRVLPHYKCRGKPSIGNRTTFGEVVQGIYKGAKVAVKRLQKVDLSVETKAQIKDEAAVMSRLHSPFLIRLVGLSFESPPLLVMELAEGGSLYSILKDRSKTLMLVRWISFSS